MSASGLLACGVCSIAGAVVGAGATCVTWPINSGAGAQAIRCLDTSRSRSSRQP